MNQYDDELKRLQEQIVRQRKLQASVESLTAQEASLRGRVKELGEIRAAEQADVDRLEGRTLAAFFYTMIGKMDEKLSQEQEEAYAAAVKYDAAARELEAVTYDLAQNREELRQLHGCRERYRQLLDQKSAEIKASDSPTAARILELESQLASDMAGIKEIQEAIEAGNTARSTVDSVLSSLNSAHGWGTWDLVGGGLITDIVKHGHLDDAQAKIEQLQIELRRFRTELADTQIYADLQVKVDGFLVFADYFFDGLFADWAVLDHINRSREQVEDIRRQIQNTLGYLHRSQTALNTHSQEVRSILDHLVTSA